MSANSAQANQTKEHQNPDRATPKQAPHHQQAASPAEPAAAAAAERACRPEPHPAAESPDEAAVGPNPRPNPAPDRSQYRASAGCRCYDRWRPGWQVEWTGSSRRRPKAAGTCRCPLHQAMSASRGWSSGALLAGFVIIDRSRAVHVSRMLVIRLDALRGLFGWHPVHILGSFFRTLDLFGLFVTHGEVGVARDRDHGVGLADAA